MNNWERIWNNRKCEFEKIDIESLINADGFDGGAGHFNISNWIKYVHNIANLIPILKDDSIFEVGCGAGAFLYPFFINSNKVSGIDYSKPLISLASKAMPKMSFKVQQADKIDTSTKYDIVIAHSVFQYFHDLKYSYTVLKKMILKANKKVAILDINDSSKVKMFHEIRQGQLSKGEYKKKYENLDHFFFSKTWFEEFAMNNNYRIEIYDQDIKGYLNSNFRFNVILHKNHTQLNLSKNI